MKAIQYTAFGESDVLQIIITDKPSYNDDEILVKIKATTVNPLDIKIRSGNMQKLMPVNLPYIPGLDVAGVAEAVGNNVSKIKTGDTIYATVMGGSYAEYIVIKEAQAALIPANLSADEAVALAVPVTTAYTLLVETAHLKKGQKILIQGAAGGVGSTIVQMAKALGAYVIGTASGEGIDLIKGLGADEAIDYKKQDFTQLVKDADIVADLVGGETQNKSFEVLKKGGQLISAVMPPSAELAAKYGITATFINATPSADKLNFARTFIEENKIKPQVAETMKLEEAATAQDMVSKGGINGKIVLKTD